ncbi:hypothetical protein [Vibrio cyclitrophicus]|uniref:hypothetical protein n=1 Tax=Vibrio cyclitrophicus TaxID=47951 RepID=UPI000C82F062|nr:hypothetical protein [Vibrio cyclitrophicus]PME36644.1 hypothetical protein BCV37_20475 [Vibrio cyclitrophicus]PME43600.1 hypothetical protein BCV36_10805 [Vibrio cyclitrophicus]PMF40022.1 hypothetical protein BCV15_17575 [Vibrio cyclitrophicus]
MGIEQKITDLQRTSAEQTAASQALSQEVAGKMGEIDRSVKKAEDKFSEFMQDRDRIGTGGSGSRRLNIFQVQISNGFNHVPDIEKPDGWVESHVSNADLYLHFKTPFNTKRRNGMFHFKVQGYAYGQSSSIDETLVGYSYVSSDGLLHVGAEGKHEPVVYRASNGDIYLRLKASILYFWTFSIDVMNVSGGLLNNGDIEMTVSPNEMLTSYP